MKYNNNEVNRVCFNGNDVLKLVYNGNVLFNNQYTIFGTCTNNTNFKLYIGNATLNCIVKPTTQEGVYSFYSNDSLANIGTNLASSLYNKSTILSIQQFNIDTSNAIDFSSMFSMCTNLKTINLSSFNLDKANRYYSFFDGCASLKKIDVTGCSDTTKTRILNQAKAVSSSFILDGDLIYLPD